MKRIFLAVLLASVWWFAACTVPAWVNTAIADAEAAAPIAGSLIAVIDPPLAPLVAIIENGFTVLASTLNTYKAAPTATNLQLVQEGFKAVDVNVAQLASAAQIKNPATEAKVTAIVQLLAQVVTEMGAQVPAARGTGSSVLNLKLQTPGTAQGWKANNFKKQFNAIIQGDARFKPLK